MPRVEIGESVISARIVPVLYTDGITEAENADLDMFGLERLENIIRASGGLSANELSREILDAVRTFSGDHPQSDDITLMVIRSL